ncbi:hypothetical protein EMIT0P100_120114 [Pseudomonas sp. IT-P100]
MLRQSLKINDSPYIFVTAKCAYAMCHLTYTRHLDVLKGTYDEQPKNNQKGRLASIDRRLPSYR